jgi:hypothetical protein
MKTYWSIDGPSKGHKGKPCFVFHKYDGSNMRAEWSRKRGWYKFGTRKCMIDHTDEIYGKWVVMFQQKYGDVLDKLFRKDKYFRGVQSVVAFAEYFGKESFSGAHKPWDTYDTVLFDVNVHKKGFMSPRDFVDVFDGIPVAELVRECNFGEELVQQVRKQTIDINSKYEIRAEVPEGVICKGDSGHRLWMCKIKTEAYKEKLKKEYEGDWIKYWEN